MANLKEMLSKEQKSVQYYHHMYDNEKNGSYIPKEPCKPPDEIYFDTI